MLTYGKHLLFMNDVGWMGKSPYAAMWTLAHSVRVLGFSGFLYSRGCVRLWPPIVLHGSDGTRPWSDLGSQSVKVLAER